MPRKKRKYTRKKKKNIIFYMKKIFLWGIIWLIVHILFVNALIVFSSFWKADVLLITWDSKQNSQNISSKLEKNINISLDLFQKEYAKKILILWENNPFKIDEVNLIKKVIIEKDIWEWNIAFEQSSIENYPKNTKIFLDNNNWESIIYSSDFWNYYKNKYFYAQRILKNNIEISYYYSSFLNSISGIFTNYYYFWKI